MKRFFLLLLVGVFLLILQTTWLSSFPVHRLRPDLLLIFTLYLAFLFPPTLGGILAFLMGYLMDLFSGNTFGFYALSRTLVFFVAQFLKERFYLEGFSFQCLFAFIFSILEGGFTLVLINALQSVPVGNLYASLFTLLLPQSLLTGLASPFLFLLFQKVRFFLFQPSEQGMNVRG
jgi:rod shape-determining protein MreD